MGRVFNAYSGASEYLGHDDFKDNLKDLIADLDLKYFSVKVFEDNIIIELKDNREDDYVKALINKHIGCIDKGR